MKKAILAALLGVVAASTAMGAEAALEFAEGGLKAYRAFGVKEALRAWEYRPLDDDTAKRLEDLRKAFGPVNGYEILAEQPAGEFYSVVYALVRMEKAPVFLRLVCFRSRGGWRAHGIATREEPFDFVPGFSTDGHEGIVEEKTEDAS